jgi:prepilin-type N-terminal cleavage/methylation domain-containing protein/prepilin-type processing-associated H-X9-DG protein
MIKRDEKKECFFSDPASRFSKAFTLIELLVVISIISMLMSIMMPALRGAREQGKRVVCQSNMRQLAIAWMMYCMENDDRMCSPETYWNDTSFPMPYSDGQDHHWVSQGPENLSINPNPLCNSDEALEDGVLWTYLKTIDIYKCKSDRGLSLRSYSISRSMGGGTTADYAMLTEVDRPSDKAVFVDADYEPYEALHGSFRPIFGWGTDNPKWQKVNGQFVTSRHDDGFNVTYADSHCGYIKLKDDRTKELTIDLRVNFTEQPDEFETNDIERLRKMLSARIK